jgi:hypothetical protein
VISTNDNILNKEFQHFLESKLIEVMKMKMLQIQFVSTVNLIQMRLMKVIHKMKSMMNKEYQHFLELKLIEVMIEKMLAIQFVSSVNLIQIQSTEVADVCPQSQSSELTDTRSQR